MQAQTIAAMQQAAPDDLFRFLTHLPFTQEAQIFYALLLAGTVGMFANWFTRWARRDIDGNLFSYLFLQNPRSTALSFSTYMGVSVAAIYGQVFWVTSDSLFVGWGMVMWLGLLNGYSIDAIMNKGQRAVWTPAQRAAQ